MSAVLSTVWADMPPEARETVAERVAAWSVSHPAKPDPSGWAALYHDAAHLVCDAALVLAGSNTIIHTGLPGGGLGCIHLPGLARPTPSALRREAVVALAGPAAEAMPGVGDFHASPGEVAAVACIVARLSRDAGISPQKTARRIMHTTAAVLSAHWRNISKVAGSMRRGPSDTECTMANRLANIRGSMNLDDLPEARETVEGGKLLDALDNACTDLITLACELREIAR